MREAMEEQILDRVLCSGLMYPLIDFSSMQKYRACGAIHESSKKTTPMTQYASTNSTM